MLFSGSFFISKQAPKRHELRWRIHVLVPHGFLPCGYQDTLTNKNWILLKLGSIMEQLLLAARSYPQGEVQVSFEHDMSHACFQSPFFFRQMQGWGNATCTKCIPIRLIEETQKREEHYRLSSCAVCVVSTTHYSKKFHWFTNAILWFQQQKQRQEHWKLRKISRARSWQSQGCVTWMIEQIGAFQYFSCDKWWFNGDLLWLLW